MPAPAQLADARQALRLTAELLRVQDAFDVAGIPFLTFKGPTLSLSLYGDVGSRRFGDVDVLLPASRTVEARRILGKLGFRPYIDVTDEQLAWLTTFRNEYVMCREGSVVELHWSVVRPGYRFSLSFDDLAPYRTSMRLAGRFVPVLEDNAMLVVLAVHGAKHGWSRRSWLTDFADLALTSDAVDWNVVFAIAEKHAASRFLLQAAWLARHELGRALPNALDNRIAEDAMSRVAGLMARRAARLGRENYLSYVSYVASMCDSRSRLRALREVFFDPTPLDCQLVDLPRSLFPLYHAVRPIRLVGKHVFDLRHRPWSA